MIVDEEGLKAKACEYARAASPGDVIYLKGELGAGKTTFARAFIQSLGVEGSVKSPTYTLIESYQTPQFPVHHLDLYRLANGEELELLGFRDLIDGSVMLIEWPEHAEGYLPEPTLCLQLTYHDDGRVLEEV